MVYNERNKGDESKMEEAAGKKRSYSIKIGSQMITIDIPEDAKEVDVDSDYTVAYLISKTVYTMPEMNRVTFFTSIIDRRD